MQIVGRKLTNLEKIGIVAAVIVIGSFLYQRYVYFPLQRKIKSLNATYQKLSSEVYHLKAQQAGGRIRRDIKKLRRCLRQERKLLEKAETYLANDSEISKISNQILAAASRSGVTVKAYNPVTKKEFTEVVGKNEGKTYYERKYYKIVLSGKFWRLRRFLKEITRLPSLVTIEKIFFDKTEKKALTATIWLSI